jgi:hypothetical protein
MRSKPDAPSGRRGFAWERWMRKFFNTCTALSVLAAFGAQSAQADMMKELGKGEGAVSIVAWAGYIERGETDKAYDWVTEFEGKTGCKVSVKTAATSDEMVALMNEGGFDPHGAQLTSGCRTRLGTLWTENITARLMSGARTF